MKFIEIALHPSIQTGVEENNFVDCTPIQEAAIPPILQGRDVAGLAQTGTGKTAAFLLPLMDRILRARQETVSLQTAVPPAALAPGDMRTKVDAPAEAAVASAESAEDPADISSDNEEAQLPKHVPFKSWRKTNYILVLVPTRELCDQVCVTAAKFGKSCGLRAAAIYGGTGYEGQKAALRSGVEFIVATPGRLIDLYKENLVDLGQVRAIVFDEADRMFDMGFKDDMKYILRRVPNDRQFLVFSATLNFDVLNTAYEFGANPVDINVSRDQAKAENVDDEIYHVGTYEKPKFLLSLLQKNAPKQAIIFSNFKHNVERISKFLTSNGVPAMGISSLISQSQRTRIMELFRAENDRNILVATDVAARGLDIKGVDLIINYELPDDAENYVHRIGRTGRAGANGKAMSLVSDKDVEALTRIESYLGHKVTIGWIDDADIVKEFKEFPRERYDEGGERSNRGGSGGFRGSPRSPGGFSRGDRDRGPRRDGRPGDRDRGPRRDGRPGGRPGGDRPRHSGGGPRGDRPSMSGPTNAATNIPANVPTNMPTNVPPSAASSQSQHQGQRPQGQHQSGGQRPQRQQHRGGGRHHHPHSPGGSSRGGKPGQQPQQRHQGGEPRHTGGSGRRHYTHRPGESAPASASPSVMTKVAGFFKKLFS